MLFAVAETGTPPPCPSTEDWVKKVWRIHAAECRSAVKKNEILPSAAAWVDLENITPSAVSQRKTDIIYDVTYMWNPKINTNESIYKTETDSQA